MIYKSMDRFEIYYGTSTGNSQIYFGFADYSFDRTFTGVGEKICCEFWRTLPSSISGTRSRAMRRWKAHDEKNYPTVLVFSFSSIEGFFCEKSFWLLLGKNDLRYSFWSRHQKNTRKCTVPLDDGYKFNFYPKKEKPRFLSFSGCLAEGARIERFVLASASC